MPRKPEESRALFDRWAQHYDATVRASGGPLEGYDESIREAAAMLPLGKGAYILDVGIGTGNFASRFAERGARISGVDISPAMLQRCRAAHPAFVLTLGSFTPIPHADGRFDAVIAAFAFHEVEPARRPDACREMARVLKPGGYICLLDIIFASPEAEQDAARWMGKYWDPDEEYPQVADLDRWLRAAGFGGLLWRQTAPCHWAVVARLPDRV